MSSLSYDIIRVFTDAPDQGNPCAVVYDADGLPDSEMLCIAQHFNYSETTFVLRPTKTDLKFRFFTPAEEIPLAGHPTIGAVHGLWQRGLLPLQKPKISIELASGVIDLLVRREGAQPPTYFMSQMPPQFMRIYGPSEVLDCFGLEAGDCLPFPLQTVSTGTPALMVPVKNKDTLAKIRLDERRFTALRDASDFFCAHIFCMEGFTKAGDVAARNFAPPPDAVEDAYTGSSMGAMGCYIAHYGLSPKTHLIAEQGHFMGMPGIGTIDVTIESGRPTGVMVGGRAVLVKSDVLKI